MNLDAIKKIVIVGGGTAGWMTAAALSQKFSGLDVNVTLIESESIGTVGVGESTLPHIRNFNQFLNIDEPTFLRETKATFKLGIAFKNWGFSGSDYIHPFGRIGHDINGVEFLHYWVRLRQEGFLSDLDHYSLPAMAARAGKFQHPIEGQESILSAYTYAFHFDAALYAKYLRDYSCRKGVVKIEGIVTQARLNPDTGVIASLILESGREIHGDLFIDCSGFRGVLIDKVLGVEFESWSQWLACDRAVAAPCSAVENEFKPFTQSLAHQAGWQWRIPLQHRTGNGHVYASSYMSDDEAVAILRSNMDGELLAEPKFFSFTAGKRKQNWRKNCVAIGLSSGFLEPLESTSIYLIQVGIQKLLDFFPDRNFYAENTAEFNRQLDAEYTNIRDFIIMHYKEGRRDDSQFWIDCRNMAVPASLMHRQSLFSQCGYVDRRQYGIYEAVCIGQGLVPKAYDFKIDGLASHAIAKYLEAMRRQVANAVESMPSAKHYIDNMVAVSVSGIDGQ